MKLRAFFALLAAATASHGYYHFLQYENRDGAQVALAQRFDLEVLTARTVPFFVSKRGPDRFAPGDTMTALVSQLQRAAGEWSDVETSELRLRFGGFNDGKDESGGAPGIDVVFEEVPPGLIALAGPVVTASPRPGQSFVPIQRSLLVLPKNLENLPSSSESTFLTLVHELGHTLGLQHSLTSAAMATQLTRTQSAGLALSDDDRAGISLLYPTRAFRSNLGSIHGRVTDGGDGVALASVVAISASGSAVGTLTNPDGTYHIEGLAPARYWVYAHPLPPTQTGESTPANIRLPLNPDGGSIQPGAVFDLQFFPGTRDHNEATSLAITAGASIDAIDFRVTRRDALKLYNVLAYSFPGQIAVRPAYVNKNGSRNFFVATGTGLMSGSNPADGLRASVLGGTTGVSGVEGYSAGYLRFNLVHGEDSGLGYRHLILSTQNDLYVQPRAFVLADRQPPRVDSISPLGEGVYALKGTGLNGETRILFDGQPAVPKSIDEDGGGLIVTAPPGPSGHRSTVTAINPDGQSSMFLQGDAPPAAYLEAPATFGITVSPSRLPTGTESVIEIQGLNTAFVDGLVSVGFSSSEIAVRRAWVVSPTRLLVQVRLSDHAPVTPVDVTVTNGLRTFTASAAFSAGPQQSRYFSLFSTTVDAAGVVTGTRGSAVVVALGTTDPPRVSIGDLAAASTLLAPSIYSIQIPQELPLGPAILRVQTANGESLPVVLQVEDLPVRILEFTTVSGTSIDNIRPAQAGDTVVARLSQPIRGATPFARLRVSVMVGGVLHFAQVAGTDTVRFTLLPSVPSQAQVVAVYVDGRPTVSETLAIR